MHWKIIMACLAISCIAAPAAAQVHRCKDAAGKTIYSDAPCMAGQSGALLERQKSREEILEERLQAAEANERKSRQQAAERESESRITANTSPAPQSVQQDKSSSYECRKAQQDHETVSSIRTGTAEERRNRINSSTIKVNTTCGIQTEMIQPPPRFTGPNGQTCHRAGAVWNCN